MMAVGTIFVSLLFINIIVDALAVNHGKQLPGNSAETDSDIYNNKVNESGDNSSKVFENVYSECLLQLSYTCLQRKTLMYIRELNKLKEVSIVGDYIKFVKLNSSGTDTETPTSASTDELSYLIDDAVDRFFDNHFIRFTALGKDVLVPQTVEEFVGRKRRKGGGGGGGGHGGDDGGKKKMMMMAMMCMKMKLMVMMPAMMGMMGMMSFKGMMFSMMSFMISKMMLLMKLLEKKGGGGGGGGVWSGGGGDAGWASGGAGGAWMPAGQDYGGGGGGYDANGQWQSRSIVENLKDAETKPNRPIISYVKPIIRYNNKINEASPLIMVKNLKDDIVKLDQIDGKIKSRRKRSIIDDLQRAYIYWTSKMLGFGYRKQSIYPKYKIINGVKYVYHPVRLVHKPKTPKELHTNINNNENKPMVISESNKGEIVETPEENRGIKKKLNKMKDNVSDTVDENPWE